MEWPPQDAAPGPLQHGVASFLAEGASTVTLLDSNFSPWWDDVIHSPGPPQVSVRHSSYDWLGADCL